MFDAETNEEVKNAGINAVSIQVQIFNDFHLTWWPFDLFSMLLLLCYLHSGSSSSWHCEDDLHLRSRQSQKPERKYKTAL